MSVLDLIQAEEEKARQKKAAAVEENRSRFTATQERARAEAMKIVEDARRQADELVAQTREKLAAQTREILASSASRDQEEAEIARRNLPLAAERIVERIEQQ